jgi:hypothetical protein
MDEQAGNAGENPETEGGPRSAPTHLNCIGSFIAYTQDGEAYVIDVFTHFGAVHNRDRARVQSGLLVLTTKDGYGVDRVAQGEYRLRDSPEISFSSNDPNAP